MQERWDESAGEGGEEVQWKLGSTGEGEKGSRCA